MELIYTPTAKRPRAPNSSSTTFHWDLSFHPSYTSELQLKPSLILTKFENGRAHELPQERIDFIEKVATEHGFTFTAVMSLRRQYIRQVSLDSPGNAFFYSHKMGNPTDINDYAFQFEMITELFLKEYLKVPTVMEKELKLQGYTETPDFVIPGGCSINGQMVYWIDCKTYYGSSSLAPDERLPVGSLRFQCSKYYDVFGPGAFLFLNGFSSDLMSQASLSSEKVMLLDSTPLNVGSLFSLPKAFKTELFCPSESIGKLIGKKGKHLRELISHTNCSIVIHQLSDKCILVISSNISQDIVDAAAVTVQGVINQQILRSTITCPAHKIGNMIGPGGVTVKKIMQLSNCLIKTQRSSESDQVIEFTADSVEKLKCAEAIVQDVIRHGPKVLTSYDKKEDENIAPQMKDERESVLMEEV